MGGIGMKIAWASVANMISAHINCMFAIEEVPLLSLAGNYSREFS